MVSTHLAETRLQQGVHGYLGGHAGDCEEARLAGSRLGGSHNVDRYEPGTRMS